MSDAPLVAVQEADLGAVVTLNEAAVPAVNRVDSHFFRRMMPVSECFLTRRFPAEVHPESVNDGGLEGFLLLLPPGLDYDSVNYRWFSERYADFLYVDRIVVAGSARRRGVGRALYDAACRRATARGWPLACEVNVEPPNPQSMAFHEAFGFGEVGRQHTEGGTKTVSLMVRPSDG